RLAGFAHQLGHQQPWNHTAVAVGKIPEIMVRTHFTAINCIFLAHALLDKGMAGFALDGSPTQFLTDGLGIPGQTRIMDDCGTGITRQETLRQQANDVITLNKVSGLIKKETTVEVTIPGNTQISLV